MESKLTEQIVRFRYALAFCLLLTTAFFASSVEYLCSSKKAKEFSARNDLIQIVTAIRHFRVDYGYGPLITNNGFIETEEANADLIRTLTGNDQRRNPRQIRYIEIPEKKATPSKPVRSGVNADTGEWVDPWGNFYRVRIAQEAGIRNPYTDDDPRYLETDAIAWSVGKDGVQGGKGTPQTMKRSDDVSSWKMR